MVDTGVMASVDLNADLAEGDSLTPQDLGVLDAVTSASLACGFHAGGPIVMRETAAACVERGVVIGAHVSYRDRQGFGRRVMDVEPMQLVDDLVEQCHALMAETAVVGGAVGYVKPHGALYHRMGVDPAVADAVVSALARLAIDVLVAQPGTVVVDRANSSGMRVVAEGFPDRGYLADGRLASRDLPGGMVDPAAAGRRAVSMMRRGGIDGVDGTWVPLQVATLCIHGDAPDAAVTARSVRASLEAEDIAVQPFLGRPAPGPSPRGRATGAGDS
jgi:5-oxoprolinase (ATP-hydrolysing) subunit A